MAASSYGEALRRLLAHEGGYSNHPADPGGPTNFGITIIDYRKYIDPGGTAADVRNMSVEDAKRIYRERYWHAMRCDELPAGVDYAVFDYGVNSGIGRAGKVLQRLCGVAADGEIGPDTIAAAKAREAAWLVNAICNERLTFLQGLRTWPVFGNGWGRRVREVRAAALAMAVAAKKLPDPTSAPATPKPPMSTPGKLGWMAAAGAAAGSLAHWIGDHMLVTAGAVVVTVFLVFFLIDNAKGGD